MKLQNFAKGASNVTTWIGSSTSVILHTLLFITSFVLPYVSSVSFERMLLVLTTIVSLEAIYLSIFIQMSLNMSQQNIEKIGENIEEISEDIVEIQEIQEEIQETQEEEINNDEVDNDKILVSMQGMLLQIRKDIEILKKVKNK